MPAKTAAARNREDRTLPATIDARVAALDWTAMASDLDGARLRHDRAAADGG